MGEKNESIKFFEIDDYLAAVGSERPGALNEAAEMLKGLSLGDLEGKVKIEIMECAGASLGDAEALKLLKQGEFLRKRMLVLRGLEVFKKIIEEISTEEKSLSVAEYSFSYSEKPEDIVYGLGTMRFYVLFDGDFSPIDAVSEGVEGSKAFGFSISDNHMMVSVPMVYLLARDEGMMLEKAFNELSEIMSDSFERIDRIGDKLDGIVVELKDIDEEGGGEGGLLN